ncbi:hypothetical protein [Desulfosarcina sp.]|uniref:hypothetical protein n=1 Tax=Desulfosarcina sp. TaxID=2027861 RepID=UPI003566242D
MKKVQKLLLAFILLACLLTPGATPADAQDHYFASADIAIAPIAFSEAAPLEPPPISLGVKLTDDEMNRIRGKGKGDGEMGHGTSPTHTGRIILWDESDSPRTGNIQNISYDSGIAGKQTNRLIFSDQ